MALDTSDQYRQNSALDTLDTLGIGHTGVGLVHTRPINIKQEIRWALNLTILDKTLYFKTLGVLNLVIQSFNQKRTQPLQRKPHDSLQSKSWQKCLATLAGPFSVPYPPTFTFTLSSSVYLLYFACLWGETSM